jgi:hypothetical protein
MPRVFGAMLSLDSNQLDSNQFSKKSIRFFQKIGFLKLTFRFGRAKAKALDIYHAFLGPGCHLSQISFQRNPIFQKIGFLKLTFRFGRAKAKALDSVKVKEIRFFQKIGFLKIVLTQFVKYGVQTERFGCAKAKALDSICQRNPIFPKNRISKNRVDPICQIWSPN